MSSRACRPAPGDWDCMSEAHNTTESAREDGAESMPPSRLTVGRARDVRSLLGKYLGRYWPQESASANKSDASIRTGMPSATLPYIRLIPWALGALFAFSFAWDFDGLGLEVTSEHLRTSFQGVTRRTWSYTGLGLPAFARILDLEGLLLTMSASGLIGFFTNWLAISMLFHPRQRRPIFGQGVIPAQREHVIDRLAEAISRELINEEIIKERIQDSGVVPKYRDVSLQVMQSMLADEEFRVDIKTLVGDYVDGVLSSESVRKSIVEFALQKLDEHAKKGLGGLALKTYRLFNEERFQRNLEEAVKQLPQTLTIMMDELDKLLDALPNKLSERSQDIEDWVTRAILSFVSSLDIYDMIIANMRGYDERQLEALIKNSSNDQLNYIKYLGGALGLVGGLVIFDKWLAIPVLGVLVATLILLDHALLRVLRYREGKRSATAGAS